MTMLMRICGCDRCGASQRLEQVQCASTSWVQVHDTRAALWLGSRDSMTRVVSVCDTCYQEIDRQGGDAPGPHPGMQGPRFDVEHLRRNIQSQEL
jgi:hypothetical protein